jgi:hypothetical protein
VCNYFDAFVKAEPWKLAGLPPGRFELFSEARRTVDRDGQRRVLAECQHALLECDPTPLPNANSHSGSIVSESTCFARVADLCHESYVLDGVQIERWLQSTLAISTSYDDSLVSRCHLADPVATERVLVKELNRCLSFRPQSIFFLDTLPPAIWTEHLSGMFAEVAANDSYALAGRTVLLRQLILRNRRCVLPILTRWINEPNQDKRIVAVDLLLPTDPELVWDEFCKQIQAGGKEAFLKMGHILAEPHGLNPALSSWKAELIEELHDMLMAAFPPNTDPVRESGVAFGYGPEDAYRDRFSIRPTASRSRRAVKAVHFGELTQMGQNVPSRLLQASVPTSRG